MKSSVTLAALLIALPVSIAAAADLPSKKEPVVAPVAGPVWTGFYAGLNAGGSWSAGGQQYGNTILRTNLLDNSLVQTGGPSWSLPSNFSGVSAGGQFGYNYQINSMFIAGLEADFQGSSMNGQGNTIRGYPQYPNPLSPDGIWSASTATANSSTAIDWWGTARGRIGVTPLSSMSNLMIYATGGFAYAGARATNTLNTVVEPSLGAGYARYSYGNTRVGWTAGGGGEWMFMPNWSAKAEYLYTDLGSARGYAMGRGVTHAPFVNAFNGSNAYRFNTVRLGVNYHFNLASMPVVAKY
jgi:outer membrane immunogenic protein